MHIFPFNVSVFLHALILSYTCLPYELLLSRRSFASTWECMRACMCVCLCQSSVVFILSKRVPALMEVCAHARVYLDDCVGALSGVSPSSVCLVSASHSPFCHCFKAPPKIGL